MSQQKPVYEQFFEEYAQLLRMRMQHYLRNIGGEAKFLNQLLIVPDENLDANLTRYAWRSVCAVNDYMEEVCFGPELVQMYFDDDLAINYVYRIIVVDNSDNYYGVEITVGDKKHEYEFFEGEETIGALGDEFWAEALELVQHETSFGTLKLDMD